MNRREMRRKRRKIKRRKKDSKEEVEWGRGEVSKEGRLEENDTDIFSSTLKI